MNHSLDTKLSNNLPQHIAIVMDGNGRWAEQRQLSRIAGHREGVTAARNIVKACAEQGIKVLSLFAFSSENWLRPALEVSALMELFTHALKREVPLLQDHNIRLRFMGDLSRFGARLRQAILEAEQLTQDNTGLQLVVAVNYGGQWDIVQAARHLAAEVSAGRLRVDDITSDRFSHCLSLSDLPEPDLFIRTSGEQRLSNFFLWQMAYTELYFTPVYWPAFTPAELQKALTHYAQRSRRFGSIDLSGEIATHA